MDTSAFLRLKEGEKAKPVILLTGDEPFFKEEVIRALEQELDGAQKVEIRVGKSGEAAQRALDEARSVSLFSERKLVLAREADLLVSEHHEELLRHWREPNEARLVLDLVGLDRRTKATKDLEKEVLVVECKPLYDTVPPWLRGAKAWETPLAEWTAARAIRSGLRMGLETAYCLTRITGNNLFEITQTIEKLRLSGIDEVKLGDVEALAGRGRRDDIFSVTEALGRRDWGRALGSLGLIFERGLPGRSGEVIGDPGTIGLIALGRIWAKVKELMKVRIHLKRGGGRSRDAIAKAAGIAPFLSDRALEEHEKWRDRNLGRMLDILEEAELALKGLEDRGKPRLILERLIVQMSLES